MGKIVDDSATYGWTVGTTERHLIEGRGHVPPTATPTKLRGQVYGIIAALTAYRETYWINQCPLPHQLVNIQTDNHKLCNRIAEARQSPPSATQSLLPESEGIIIIITMMQDLPQANITYLGTYTPKGTVANWPHERQARSSKLATTCHDDIQTRPPVQALRDQRVALHIEGIEVSANYQITMRRASLNPAIPNETTPQMDSIPHRDHRLDTSNKRYPPADTNTTEDDTTIHTQLASCQQPQRIRTCHLNTVSPMQ
jgi:hypothetical protein